MICEVSSFFFVPSECTLPQSTVALAILWIDLYGTLGIADSFLVISLLAIGSSTKFPGKRIEYTHTPARNHMDRTQTG